ncbi:hypothetical protein I6A84_40465, partial [Frankia sp. CNm7]|nr:hypothetical protein [Frankia nepalensis]
MHEFLVFTISGLTTAGIYAISASGLTLTYVTTGVFNIAHGATGMLAAFTYWQLAVAWGWPVPLALLFCVLVAAPLFGLLLERVVMRRRAGAPASPRRGVTVAGGVVGLGRGADRADGDAVDADSLAGPGRGHRGGQVV